MERIVKKYNVLCVTKTSCGGRQDYHLPFAGVATVITDFKEEFGIVVGVKSRVGFESTEGNVGGELLGVNSGLDSSCITLTIEHYDPACGKWTLYTDTPAGNKSVEEIREIAKRTIANRRQR